MARLSVYIPDELLKQARTVAGGRSGPAADAENTSQLIQRALQRFVDEESRPSYAHAPADAARRLAAVRDRLLAEARKDYELGYTVAVEAAGKMPLFVLNSLVREDFDLERWLKPFRSGYNHDLVERTREVPPVPIEEVDEAFRRALRDGTLNADPAPDRDDPWWWLFKSAEALGWLANPIDFDVYAFTPTSARQRGYLDAMRAVWSAVEQPDRDALDADAARSDTEPSRRAPGGRLAREVMTTGET